MDRVRVGIKVGFRVAVREDFHGLQFTSGACILKGLVFELGLGLGVRARVSLGFIVMFGVLFRVSFRIIVSIVVLGIRVIVTVWLRIRLVFWLGSDFGLGLVLGLRLA